MSHSEMMKKAANATLEQAMFVLRDCREAITANPESPKVGEYTDLSLYMGMRINEIRTGRMNSVLRAWA